MLKKRHLTLHFLVVIGTSLAYSEISNAQEQYEVQVAELLSAWERCESQARTGEWDSLIENKGSKEVPALKEHGNTKVGSGQFVMIQTPGDGRPVSVFGLNQDYIFRLKSLPNGQYLLESLYSHDEAPSSELQSYKRMLENRMRHPALKFMFSIPWLTVASSSEFRILNSQKVLNNGRAAIEIEFECSPTSAEHEPGVGKDNNRLVPKIRNGHATFLMKENDFLPVTWSFEGKFFPDKDYFQIETTIEYDFELASVPQPVKRTTRRIVNSAGDVENVSIKYVSFGTSPPNSAFRISAFGLPEPEFVSITSGVPIVFWFLLTGVVICFYGYYLVRRNTTQLTKQ